MMTPPGAAKVLWPVSETRRWRRLAFSLGQLAFGCLLFMIGIRTESPLLIIGGGFLASWFWIPLSIAARDKSKAKSRFGYLLMAAALLVASGMVIVFFRLPDKGYFVMLMVGVIGMMWLIVPVMIAWALAGASRTTLPRTWGRAMRPRTVAGLGLIVDADSDTETVRLTIEVRDPRYLGQPACLEIYRLAETHDSSPIHDLMILTTRELVLDRERIDLALPAGAIRGFKYLGKQVSVKTFAELQLADGLVWETRVCTEVGLPEYCLAESQGDAKLLANPKDVFCLVSNLRAIPLLSKATVLVLAAVGAGVVVANTAVGVHDQFAAAGGHVMYSHGDGDSQSPLMNSLFLSGIAGTGIWLALRRQLQTYTTFRLGETPGTIGRETVLAIDELVHGRPVVDLENVTVRVIACNLEKGCYTRGHGSDQSTISFAEPVRAIVLFEQSIPRVLRGQKLEHCLNGLVRFAPAFDFLLPPNHVSQTHGLFLQWQVQLLHGLFVDHELIPPPCEYQKFFEPAATTSGPLER